MKLAFVSTILGYPWGGADVLWTRAAAHLLALQHRVLLAVNDAVSTHPRIQQLLDAGAELHRRHKSTQQRGGRDRLRATVGRHLGAGNSLLHALDHSKPDHVVLCQGGSFDFLIEDGLMCWLRETGTPYSLLSQSGDENLVLSSEARAISQAVFTAAHATIFVSTHNRTHAARQSGAELPHGHVIPNPVELDVAEPLPWPNFTTPRLALVARLDRDAKGIDLLFDALELLRDSSWQLEIYGRGPDELLLRERCEELALNQRIVFAGYESNVRSIWLTHHLLVLGSRREGCALAMLEAMACGRPVLMPDVGGASDWIADGRNGFLCSPNSVSALATVLRKAMGEFDRWSALGLAAHQTIVERLPRSPEQEVIRIITAKRWSAL